MYCIMAHLCFADLGVESVRGSAQQFPHGSLSLRLVLRGIETVFALARLRAKELTRETLAVPVADRIARERGQ